MVDRMNQVPTLYVEYSDGNFEVATGNKHGGTDHLKNMIEISKDQKDYLFSMMEPFNQLKLYGDMIS